MTVHAKVGHCQEASALSGETYIPCNKPATKIIEADGREVPMCDACAWHSTKNRGLRLVREIPEDQQVMPSRSDNGPPDPIDEICATYAGVLSESSNWLDGQKVTTEAEMKAVDEIRKQAREWRLALEAGQKSASAPLHDAWKGELARWKPTLDDAKRIEDGLKSLLDGFKQKLAAEKAEAERAAQAEAARKRREAEEAARQADPANLEQQRAAAEAQREAEEAQRRAADAKKQKVTGLRTVTLYEVEDHRAALHDIATNDRDAITAFIDDYVRRNHKARAINGVRVWQDKVVA